MKEKNEVVVQYKNGFAEVSIGDNIIRVARRDETTREYLCPVELVSAALGTWITLTISAVAEYKKIQINEIQVRINRITDESISILTSFNVFIRLDGDFTDREKILLFNSARKCEVNKLLNGDFDFNYRLIEGEINQKQ